MMPSLSVTVHRTIEVSAEYPLFSIFLFFLGEFYQQASLGTPLFIFMYILLYMKFEINMYVNMYIHQPPPCITVVLESPRVKYKTENHKKCL